MVPHWNRFSFIFKPVAFLTQAAALDFIADEAMQDVPNVTTLDNGNRQRRSNDNGDESGADGITVVDVTADSLGGVSVGPILEGVERVDFACRNKREDEEQVSISISDIWKRRKEI